MRKKVIDDVPCYGNVDLDSDEKAALSLSPKFRLFPKVTVDSINLQSEIAPAKARWSRADRDVNRDGEIVLEDDDFVDKTDEDIVKENLHLE